MFVPAQGFRHAATLLLTNGAPSDSRRCVTGGDALRARTACARAGCPCRRHARPRPKHRVAHRRIHRNDRSHAADVRSRCGAKSARRGDPGAHRRRAPADSEARDLFLIYVPEDRLPLLRPSPSSWIKRRVSVAFADYEVATAAATDRGDRARPRASPRRRRALDVAFERFQLRLPA